MIDGANIQFVCDDEGRIVVAQNNGVRININWQGENLDKDYCNLIIIEVCSNRGIEMEI